MRGRVAFYLRYPRSARFYDRWRRTLGDGKALEPLQAREPWISYPAIAWLRRKIRPGDTVFEWGSGGSTLFFADRARAVVSVEHDPEWHRLVENALEAEALTNVDLILVEPSPEPLPADAREDVPQGYASTSPEYQGRQFFAYCTKIHETGNEPFDIVFVDGRARGSCVYEAISWVKPGGWLIVDDSDRDEYAEALALLSGWRQQEIAGPVAGLDGIWPTKVFRKPTA